MKVNMESLLKEQKKKDQEILNSDQVKDVKLLLEGDSQEDLRILRNLSSNSQLTQIERIRGRQIELEKLEKNYAGDIYNINQIKNICIDYHLRFLPSVNYTGSFDVELARKIKQFSNDAKIELNEWNLNRKFFIMAPEEMFMLREEKYIRKKQLDPIIFYKIDEYHYRMVHKWGNDFTIFRLLDGLRWKSYWSHMWFNMFMLMPIVGFVFAMIFGIDDITYYTKTSAFIITFFSFIFSWLFFGVPKQDDFSVIKGYFSKYNWDSDSKLVR